MAQFRLAREFVSVKTKSRKKKKVMIEDCPKSNAHPVSGPKDYDNQQGKITFLALFAFVNKTYGAL